MEAITHLNVHVVGVPFQKILGLEIKHFINDHATAVLTAEAEPMLAMSLLNRADEKVSVRIVTTAAGQPDTLFYGVLSNAEVDAQGEYAIVTITLKSFSALVDYKKGNQSFQNTSESHESVISTVLNGAINLDFLASDKPIGHIIVQCNETPWEFAKRMASEVYAPLVASLHKSLITVGIPHGVHSYTLSNYSTTSSAGMGGMTPGSSVGVCVKTMQYAYVGDSISLSGRSLLVKGITASLQTGVLESQISVSDASGFRQIPITNTQISGKMFLGKVMAVQLDKVKVHLVDIDDSFSEGSCNVWLPYSTAYSSSDGSGFYCMPAVGDQVRVFFPGSNEGQAFAASSVSQSPGAKVTDKQWTGPNGKQILLTDEGIFITTNANDNKIFINLTDANGITISSDKNINICAKKNLSLISNNSISISAKNDILISSADAYIDVTPKEIEIAANNVVIK